MGKLLTSLGRSQYLGRLFPPGPTSAGGCVDHVITSYSIHYTKLYEPLGASVLMNMDRIAFLGKAMNEPMLAVCIPYNEEDPAPGNGNMIAISPGSKEAVDTFYRKAIELVITSYSIHYTKLYDRLKYILMMLKK